MARSRTRTWDSTTELARVVAHVGGTKFAAAYANTSEEWIVQCLLKGHMRDGQRALQLADRARALAGYQANLRELFGAGSTDTGPRGGVSLETHEEPTRLAANGGRARAGVAGTDPVAPAAQLKKGVGVRRNSSTRLTASHRLLLVGSVAV